MLYVHKCTVCSKPHSPSTPWICSGSSVVHIEKTKKKSYDHEKCKQTSKDNTNNDQVALTTAWELQVQWTMPNLADQRMRRMKQTWKLQKRREEATLPAVLCGRAWFKHADSGTLASQFKSLRSFRITTTKQMKINVKILKFKERSSTFSFLCGVDWSDAHC